MVSDRLPRRRWRGYQANYPAIFALSEDVRCYALTEQQRALLLHAITPYEHKTRWHNDYNLLSLTETEDIKTLYESLVLALTEDRPCSADIPEPDECLDVSLNDPSITWTPQDPYTQPLYTPIGYIFPPFRVVDAGNIPDMLLGFEPGNVITTAVSFPTGWMGEAPPEGLPRFRFHFSGTGTIELHLLTMPVGGLLLITVDDIMHIEVTDTNRDLISIPPETSVDFVIEIVSNSEGNHYLDCTFLPNIQDQPPYLFYGGGIAYITLCGNITALPAQPIETIPPVGTVFDFGDDDMLIRQNPDNPCLLEKSTDCETWIVWADLSLCNPPTQTITDPLSSLWEGYTVNPANSLTTDNCILAKWVARALYDYCAIWVGQIESAVAQERTVFSAIQQWFSSFSFVIGFAYSFLGQQALAADMEAQIDDTTTTLTTTALLLAHVRATLEAYTQVDDLALMLYCAFSASTLGNIEADDIPVIQGYLAALDTYDDEPTWTFLAKFVGGIGLDTLRGIIVQAASTGYSTLPSDCDCQNLTPPAEETSFNFLDGNGILDLQNIVPTINAYVDEPVYDAGNDRIVSIDATASNTATALEVRLTRATPFAVGAVTFRYRAKKTRGGSCWMKVFDNDTGDQIGFYNLSLRFSIGVEHVETLTLTLPTPRTTNSIRCQLIMANLSYGDAAYAYLERLDVIVS